MGESLTNKYWRDINTFLISLVAFTIPFGDRTANSLMIILSGLSWLFIIIRAPYRLRFYKNVPFLISASLYLVAFLTFSHSKSIDEVTAFHFEKTLPLILLPLYIFALKRKELELIRKNALSFFIAGCLGVLIVYISNAFLKDSFFLSKDEIPNTGTYFALHLSFAALVLLSGHFSDRFKHNSKLTKRGVHFLIIIFSLIVFATPAKTQVISLVLIFGILFFRYSKRSLKKAIWFTFSLVMLLSSIVLFVPSANKEFKEIVYGKWSFVKDGKSQTSISMRSKIWECAWEIGSENWGSGVGISGLQPKLDDCYKNKKFWGWVFHYNTHSQYLNALAMFGIFGLFILLLNQFLGFFLALTQRDDYYLIFVLLMGLSMVTETMLVRNKGVVFFAFMNTLFLCYNFYQYKQIKS